MTVVVEDDQPVIEIVEDGVLYGINIHQSTGMMRYEYADEEFGFTCSMMSEVGESYQPVFRKMIKEKGWVVDYGVDLDYYPWMADFYRGLIP